MGIAALVLGITGLLGSFIPCLGMYAIPLTALAVIFGAIGMRGSKDPRASSGRGMALAGIICGGLGTLIAAYWIYLYFTIAPGLEQSLHDGIERGIQREESGRGAVEQDERAKQQQLEADKPKLEAEPAAEPEKK
jgi:hypothetical protein